eukprot:NODE_157_length_16664_cov_0.301781.p2 type:complete len:523 gc:universal NODE_157_length_16664_cov_0.301781:12816-11248(-)
MTREINLSADTNVKLTINEDFAKKFEHNKKREELQYLEDQDLSDSTSEDEDAEMLTNAVDCQIMNVIGKIRAKDPSIYKSDIKFFDDSHFDKKIAKSAKVKSVKLKDLERKEILDQFDKFDNTNEVSELKPKVLTYEEEQSALKDAFKVDDVDKDEDFLIVKNELVADMEDEKYKMALVESVEDVNLKKELESVCKSKKEDHELDQDEWLLKYVLSKGWMGDEVPGFGAVATYSIKDNDNFESSAFILQNGEPVQLYEDKSDDDLVVDKFEIDAQYRFQEKGAELIKSYSREVTDSARRPDTRRADARNARKERKEMDRLRKTENLKRLKNLKKEEILDKVHQISEISGLKTEILVDKLNLDDDYDADKWDQQMDTLFDDHYYNENDSEDIEGKLEIDNYQSTNTDEKTFKQLLDDDNNELKGKIDEYFKLDYEDIVGDIPVRFKYRDVEPDHYGLNAADILLADEKELNRTVGLKRLAPYTEKPYKVSKQRVFELKRHIREKLEKVEDKEQKKLLRKWIKK